MPYKLDRLEKLYELSPCALRACAVARIARIHYIHYYLIIQVSKFPRAKKPAPNENQFPATGLNETIVSFNPV